jgi:hypothetical protein
LAKIRSFAQLQLSTFSISSIIFATLRHVSREWRITPATGRPEGLKEAADSQAAVEAFETPRKGDLGRCSHKTAGCAACLSVMRDFKWTIFALWLMFPAEVTELLLDTQT